MDVEQFLINQGWTKGEGLRPGSLKKPLLVAHKYDTKGLGSKPESSDLWWEQVFDGHLKALDFKTNSKFAFDEEKRKRTTSPLYAQFTSGGMLSGTLETKKRKREEEKKEKKQKKEKKRRKEEKKEKKEKKKRKEELINKPPNNNQ